MNAYELIFEIAPPSEGDIEALYAAEDALVSTHGRSTVVTITAEDASAFAAAHAGMVRLRRHGLEPLRLYEDLVTRAEIARRADVTPQAVGQWIRGERQQGSTPPFPEPHNYAGGSVELWLWGDVNTWLAHLDRSDGLSHPSHADYVLVNQRLLKPVLPVPPRRAHGSTDRAEGSLRH